MIDPIVTDGAAALAVGEVELVYLDAQPVSDGNETASAAHDSMRA